jgi:lipopolysaccharide export system protein LptC
MTLRNFFFLLLLLSTGFLIFYHLSRMEKPSFILTTDQNYPDAYAENLLAIQMDKEGLPSQELQSIYLLHYPKDNSVHLTRPFVTLYQLKNPPWKLNALSSIVYPDQHIIKLTGQVKAHQAAGSKNVDTTLLTDQATIYTETKIVETDQPVTLLRPGLRIQSVGARANMKDGEVILSSNAQVYYNDKQAKRAADQHSGG